MRLPLPNRREGKCGDIVGDGIDAALSEAVHEGLEPMFSSLASSLPLVSSIVESEQVAEPGEHSPIGGISASEDLAVSAGIDGLRPLLQQMARVEQQLAVLSVNTQWSMDHIFEHLSEVKKVMTPKEMTPSSNAGNPASFPTNHPHEMMQIVERLEKSVKQACSSLQDPGGAHSKIASAVQELSSKFSAFELATRVSSTDSTRGPVQGSVVDLSPVQEEAETGGTPRSPAMPKALAPPPNSAADFPEPEKPSKRAGDDSLADDMVAWMESNAEVFHWKVFCVEFAVQIAYYTFGMLAVPVAYCLLGSREALDNRAFFPKGCNTFILSNLVVGGLLLTVLIIWIGYGRYNGETDPVELLMLLTGLVLRCVVIAQKYAYMPAPVYDMWNKVTVPFQKVQDTLLIAAWLNISDENIDKTIKTAKLTFLGPMNDTMDCPRLKFLDTPQTLEQLLVPSRMQGKMTRSMVAEVMLHGELKDCSQCRGHLDLSLDLKPESDVAPPAGDAEGIELSEFFQFLVKAVLRHEKNTILRRLFPALPVFIFVSCLMPGLARLYTHGTFLGTTWSCTLISILGTPVMMAQWFAFMTFVYVATLDLFRRRTLVMCLCALLSNRVEDRRHVPTPIRALGILDLRGIECVDAFRGLRELCFVWGKNFSIRCIRVLEVNIAGSGMFIAMFLFCTENAMYSVISQLLVIGVVYMSCMQMVTILLSSVIGQAVNDATKRCVYLLNHHRTAMSMALRHKECDEDHEALHQSTEGIEVVAENMALEQETNPVAIMGMTMGLGLLSSLYMVVALIAQRFAAYCSAEPHMCFME